MPPCRPPCWHRSLLESSLQRGSRGLRRQPRWSTRVRRKAHRFAPAMRVAACTKEICTTKVAMVTFPKQSRHADVKRPVSRICLRSRKQYKQLVKKSLKYGFQNNLNLLFKASCRLSRLTYIEQVVGGFSSLSKHIFRQMEWLLFPKKGLVSKKAGMTGHHPVDLQKPRKGPLNRPTNIQKWLGTTHKTSKLQPT